MTRANLNPARDRIRLALARLLSEYAQEKGLQAAIRLQPDKSKEGGVSPQRRGSSIKEKFPDHDLAWVDEGKLSWRFYILPRRSTLERLRLNRDFAADTIACIDPANNLGIIAPAQFLDLLERDSTGAGKERLRSLAREIPRLEIPFPDYHFKGVVQKNYQFVKDHFSLRIRAGLVQKAVPGQFLQLICDAAPHSASPKYRCVSYADRRWPRLKGIELLERRPFLRRPFSIASCGPAAAKNRLESSSKLPADWLRLVNWVESEFEIIYRRVPGGAGTGALARYQAGDEIDVIGPLGKGFKISPPPEDAVLVGGGIGAPPLLFLAEELVRSGVRVKVFLGALGKSRIPFPMRGGGGRVARFERLGLQPVICTDDGSAGRRGLVTDALLDYIKREGKAPTKMFACGPRPMLAALEGIADRFDLPCEVLLEERMACGFGACISCVCAVKEPGQKSRFTRICTEGPAFDVKTVMWHA